MSESIYASWKPVLEKIMHRLVDYLENKNAEKKASTGESAFEHINYRIKGEESMRDKCRRKELSLIHILIVYRQSCIHKEIIKKKMKCSATRDGVGRRSIY